MRAIICGLALLGLAALLSAGAQAGGDKKDVKLTGKITCAKCDLGVEKACATVIVVKKDDKDITYYFTKESNKKYHGDICTEAKNGTVTGTVTKEGKKQIIAVKELKYE